MSMTNAVRSFSSKSAACVSKTSNVSVRKNVRGAKSTQTPKYQNPKHRLPRVYAVPMLKIRMGSGKWPAIIKNDYPSRNIHDNMFSQVCKFSTLEEKEGFSEYLIPVIWRSGSYIGENGEGTTEAFIAPAEDNTCKQHLPACVQENALVPVKNETTVMEWLP